MDKRMRAWSLLGIVALAVGLLPSLAWAQHAKPKSKSSHRRNQSISPWTRDQGWGSQATGKLFYGAKNTLLGWTELFTEPYAASQAGRSVLGGLGKGALNAVGDTIGGAANLVTFPLTNVDVRLPDGGV